VGTLVCPALSSPQATTVPERRAAVVGAGYEHPQDAAGVPVANGATVVWPPGPEVGAAVAAEEQPATATSAAMAKIAGPILIEPRTGLM
jgi:hypothetical protein